MTKPEFKTEDLSFVQKVFHSTYNFLKKNSRLFRRLSLHSPKTNFFLFNKNWPTKNNSFYAIRSIDCSINKTKRFEFTSTVTRLQSAKNYQQKAVLHILCDNEQHTVNFDVI